MGRLQHRPINHVCGTRKRNGVERIKYQCARFTSEQTPYNLNIIVGAQALRRQGPLACRAESVEEVSFRRRNITQVYLLLIM